jgi:uncharacterized spore protein YtfJ
MKVSGHKSMQTLMSYLMVDVENVFLDQIKHSKTILTPVATTTIGAPNKVLRKRDKKANQKGTPLPLTTEIGDR